MIENLKMTCRRTALVVLAAFALAAPTAASVAKAAEVMAAPTEAMVAMEARTAGGLADLATAKQVAAPAEDAAKYEAAGSAAGLVIAENVAGKADAKNAANRAEAEGAIDYAAIQDAARDVAAEGTPDCAKTWGAAVAN